MQSKEVRVENVVKKRLPHFHPNFPIILFWSQKSGCTTFLKWFFFQVDLLEEAIDYNPWVHFYENEVYKQKPTYMQDVIDHLLTKKKDTLKLVRNPYKRAVSQFLILATSKGNQHWEKEWEKIREFFYHDKNSTKGITFKQFLQYIKTAEGYDSHFAPQYEPGEEEFVDQYIYLETFQKQIKQIEDKYKLKSSNLLELSKSTHHLSPAMKLKGNFADKEISESTFITTGKFPTYKSFYDKEAIQLVNTVFSNDFEVYGYKKLKK
ncbi:sulfotransferase family protein [Caldibacillus sp. 210928-DFI.2.22]|uniref:Beta-galactosidase n=1 Tax=Caldibacillus thermoamylovorans TaxID=35841 RepID=A0ABD4A3E7_9BACI|nr:MULTISPECIES: sulfotransferase family 2 domain-containing protein [Caldibacillus]KIO68659.1 Beta-galactosidase [Caldibacillus thermoamylovorans]KIO71510.1 Beta-galactosidase [Caldibacillus thermoamylovorans]MCB7069858.1 sulfotransferase family protein [Caldibacillus sp. 210928-DFI.2.22]MCB7073350.1 sulfotransferase family protein [Caldibacillus sp. 210928-DFI.2.18]